ncbi:MAG: nitroreductase family protein [Planctomycetes bacterium]|nr:nitroreductase family protein [Planctomycetota bacterium]
MSDAIIHRRSCRSYLNKKVENDVLYDLIDKARWAPTNCNTQKSKYLLIDNDSLKQKIVDHGGAGIINNSPQGIFVLYDNQSDNTEYKDYIQSAAASIQNLCLHAHSLGLGTCWICHLPRKATLRTILSIPSNYDPIAYIMIGFPSKKTREVPRKYPLESIISVNRFDFENEIIRKSPFKKIARKCYYMLPVFIKKKINPYIDKLFVKKFDN